ncbi:MAG: hypothetical protein Q8N77_06495 [Nanoarchaeota archaeon]|nr:hypothetical protein [Nanoarchaeota archaeon]
MKLTKKGQAEDFFADLIPSLIIIVIGLFILSQMNTENEKTTNNKVSALEDALKAEITTLADYLNREVDVDDKKMPLSDLISLSYKNEAYKKKMESELKKIQLISVEPPAENTFCTWRMCLRAQIYYPDSPEPLKIEDDCIGKEKVIHLPTYDGQYITMNTTLDKTMEICSTPV